jgi:hypothetical protein
MDTTQRSDDQRKYAPSVEKSWLKSTLPERSVSVERILFIIPYMGLETASYLTFQLSRNV